MKELVKKLSIKVHEDFKQLSALDKELIERATAQLDNAYAPYSNFHVGSALRLENGNIYVGSNQENASYPLCMCGERIAIYNAASNEPGIIIDAIAITAKNLKKAIDAPISPCGACRQVLLEFEIKQKKAMRILLKADGPEIYEYHQAQDLLPFSFDPSFL